MSTTWNAQFSAINAFLLAPGEPVVYQPVVGGGASGNPITLKAIRHKRVPGESGPVGNFEEIEIDPNPLDPATGLPLLASPPSKGDWVTAWGIQFTVTTTRQPEAYGLVILTLIQRAGPAV